MSGVAEGVITGLILAASAHIAAWVRRVDRRLAGIEAKIDARGED